MREGAWHQLGWVQQKLVLDQLDHGAGTGVVISPRDLKLDLAADYAGQYRERGASVLFDPQWHRPEFSNPLLASYPTSDLRASLPSLNDMSNADLQRLKDGLILENQRLKTDAVIAPAVLYAAGQPTIVQINSKLHNAALDAAAALNVPCYATAFLDASVTNSMDVVESVLSSISSLTCDGWYFAFEFPVDERIPSIRPAVYRCLRASLLLALTGKPVMHAYAGPMGILSIASGCRAAACGADQTQWKLCVKRFEPSTETGGDARAPARYFSRNLWGTIIVPDELEALKELEASILHATPFASVPLEIGWNRAKAKKHNLYTICKGIQDVAATANATEACQVANSILNMAIQLHAEIENDYGAWG
jgi:hypothetical protein